MITASLTAFNEPQLNRTIDNLFDTAKGDIEVIVSLDGIVDGEAVSDKAIVIRNDKPLGRRIGFNNIARKAKGDYLFIVDAHCKMTEEWDLKMLESCPDKGIIVSCIQDMHAASWELRPGIYQHVYLNRGWEEKWWNRKPVEVTEEMMCFTGCSWLIPKDYYWECGGYDESLGEYGWDGPEWACKVWMGDVPGKVYLRSDVICGHIFGTNEKNKLYPCKKIPYPQYKKYMHEKYKDKVRAFRKYFAPVPDEHDNKKKKPERIERVETIVNKIDTLVEREGDAISKITKKYYKPQKVLHNGEKTDKEVEAIVMDLITEVEREEVVLQ